MKQQTVLLFGGNYFPEPIGIGKYNGEMVKWLADQGYNCTVVTTFPYYPDWKIQAPYIRKSLWYKSEKIILKNGSCIKIVRCPSYIPKRPKEPQGWFPNFHFSFQLFLFFLVYSSKANSIILLPLHRHLN